MVEAALGHLVPPELDRLLRTLRNMIATSETIAKVMIMAQAMRATLATFRLELIPSAIASSS
jgi:hypothetical protein